MSRFIHPVRGFLSQRTISRRSISLIELEYYPHNQSYHNSQDDDDADDANCFDKEIWNYTKSHNPEEDSIEEREYNERCESADARNPHQESENHESDSCRDKCLTERSDEWWTELRHDECCTDEESDDFHDSHELYLWSRDKFEDARDITKYCTEDEERESSEKYDTYEREESDEERLDPSESTPECDKEKYSNNWTDDECWERSEEEWGYPDGNESDSDRYSSFYDALPERDWFVISICKEEEEKTKYTEHTESNQEPEESIFTSKICLIRWNFFSEWRPGCCGCICVYSWCDRLAWFCWLFWLWEREITAFDESFKKCTTISSKCARPLDGKSIWRCVLQDLPSIKHTLIINSIETIIDDFETAWISIDEFSIKKYMPSIEGIILREHFKCLRISLRYDPMRTIDMIIILCIPVLPRNSRKTPQISSWNHTAHLVNSIFITSKLPQYDAKWSTISWYLDPRAACLVDDIDSFIINGVVITEDDESFDWFFCCIDCCRCCRNSSWFRNTSRRCKYWWTYQKCEQRQGDYFFHKYELYNNNKYILQIKVDCQNILPPWQNMIYLYTLRSYENTLHSQTYGLTQKPPPCGLSLAPLMYSICPLW